MATSTSRSPGRGSPGASEPGTESIQYDSRRYVSSEGMPTIVARFRRRAAPGRVHRVASPPAPARVGHPGGMPDDTPAVEALPGHRQSFGPYRVCMVCLGNICRSPMAEAVLREELARAGADVRAGEGGAQPARLRRVRPPRPPDQAVLARCVRPGGCDGPEQPR